MKNVIKCEFCGTTIDLDNTDTCGTCNNSIFLDPKKDKTLLEILCDDNEEDKMPINEKTIETIFLLDELYKRADPDAITFDDFECAIIGVSKDGAIVYDYDRMVTLLVIAKNIKTIDAEIEINEMVEKFNKEALKPIVIKIDFKLLKNTL